jgi:hypothetical protein
MAKAWTAMKKGGNQDGGADRPRWMLLDGVVQAKPCASERAEILLFTVRELEARGLPVRVARFYCDQHGRHCAHVND